MDFDLREENRMADMMTFPNTVEEFMEQYKIVDTEKIYTNGAELVPIFRMMQWFERVSATDTISRQAAIDAANDWLLDCFKVKKQDRSCGLIRRLEDLPPAQPDTRLEKIADLVDGSIDHFDLEDAMDLLYQIKDVLNG